jgi:hypothetical protein
MPRKKPTSKKVSRKSIKRTKRTKPFVEKVLVDYVGSINKRQSPLVQRYYRRQYITGIKYKVKKSPLSKKNKQLLSYVKKHKAAVAKRYNSDLVNVMKFRGYFPPEIRAAQEYSLVGKNVHTALDRLPLFIPNSNVSKYKYKGKWVSLKKKKAIIARAVKAARIQSYMDILGVTKAKAKEILNVIEKDTKQANLLKSLIY